MILPTSLLALSSLLLSTPTLESEPPSPKNSHHESLKSLSEIGIYTGLGAAFGLGSFAVKLYENSSSCSLSGECSMAHELFTLLSNRFYRQRDRCQSGAQKTQILPSHSAFYDNQKRLRALSRNSIEEEELIHFLSHRFLAKATGFIPSFVSWVYPCFDLPMQVHPETTCSYARSPSIDLPSAYKKQVDLLKHKLPHPKNFPLLLTRPSSITPYLPSCSTLGSLTPNAPWLSSLQNDLLTKNSPVLLDCTKALRAFDSSNKLWLTGWDELQKKILSLCHAHGIDVSRLICFEQVNDKHVGALRILPLYFTMPKQVKSQYEFLLSWLSTFGLSANRIELDRMPKSLQERQNPTEATDLEGITQEEFIDFLEEFARSWRCDHNQKALMVDAFFSCMEGVAKQISASDYTGAQRDILEMSFFHISKLLGSLSQHHESLSFYSVISEIEKLYCHLSAILEITTPYQKQDFPHISEKTLTMIPKELKDKTSYALHPSAMTSLAGLFKATSAMNQSPPKILYGQNSYFECVEAAHFVSEAKSLAGASSQDLIEADIYLAQFSPVWKGLRSETKQYSVEDVDSGLKALLDAPRKKPLILALDCTFNYINSPYVQKILQTYHSYIEKGQLAVAVYRSGLKFDLFGMDNFSGAPFFLIKNHDIKWEPFSCLTQDPALQTDLLSYNWFCLAYESAYSQLEDYRRQVFTNTRELLNRLPNSLFNEGSPYSVTPIEKAAHAAFIDINVKGPLHKLKTETLIAAYFALKNIDEGFPLFYRISIGLYHANLTKLSGQDRSSVRLTVGLDPEQIETLSHCLEKIAALNP